MSSAGCPAGLLFGLAAECIRQGNYVAAVRALLPICDLHQLPTTTAAARLAIAQLLLDHFQNAKEAKAQLTRAVRRTREKQRGAGQRQPALAGVAAPPAPGAVAGPGGCATWRGCVSPYHACPPLLAQDLELSQASGSWVLKCQACQLLARCQLMLGAPDQQRAALLRGVLLCKEGATSPERCVGAWGCQGACGACAASRCAAARAAPRPAPAPRRHALQRWHAHFMFSLAEHALSEEGPGAALEALQSAEALDGQLTQAERILHLLCRAHVHLAEARPGARAVFPGLRGARRGTEVLAQSWARGAHWH